MKFNRFVEFYVAEQKFIFITTFMKMCLWFFFQKVQRKSNQYQSYLSKQSGLNDEAFLIIDSVRLNSAKTIRFLPFQKGFCLQPLTISTSDTGPIERTIKSISTTAGFPPKFGLKLLS
jgi:hypothetical protein